MQKVKPPRDDGIPAAFDLASHEITVITVPRKKWKHGPDTVGVWLPTERRIEIVGTLRGSYRQAVFVHELVHALFEVAGHEELSADEGIVDRIAQLLAQALRSFR
jgi:hypothetical protein